MGLEAPDRKEMFAEPKLWKELVAHIPHVNARLEGVGMLGAGLKLCQDKLPLQFQVVKKNVYQLNIGNLLEKKPQLLPAYQCAIMDGELYMLGSQEMRQLQSLEQAAAAHSGNKLDHFGATIKSFRAARLAGVPGTRRSENCQAVK